MARVLVIDDDVQTCQIIRSTLEGSGHTVEFAHDGREGLESFADGDYDLVLCDLFLPEIMGYDVCARIKSSPQSARVLSMSGICRSPEDAKDLGIPVRGDDFVMKPLDIGEVQEKVERLLGLEPSDTLGEPLSPATTPEQQAIEDTGRASWTGKLAGRVVEIFANRRTGTLRLRRGELAIELAFAKGFPVEVVVPFRRENVGLFLIQQGRLTVEEYEEALQMMIERRQTLEEALWDLGYVRDDELKALGRAHKRETLVSCFAWGSGDLDFVDGPATGDAGFQLNPSTLVLDGVERAFPAPGLARYFQERSSHRVRPGPHFDQYLNLFAPLLYRTGLHAQLGRETAVHDLLLEAGEDRETVCRILKTFEVLRIIEVFADRSTTATAPSSREAIAVDTSPAEPFSVEPPFADSLSAAPSSAERVFVEASGPEDGIELSPHGSASGEPAMGSMDPDTLRGRFLSDDNADHYQVLGVAPSASEIEIRDAFLTALDHVCGSSALANDPSLRGEITLRLAAAYGALADPQLRAYYDGKRHALRQPAPAFVATREKPVVSEPPRTTTARFSVQPATPPRAPEGVESVATPPTARPPSPSTPTAAPKPALQAMTPLQRLLARGHEALAKSEFSAALDVFIEAAELSPDDPEAHIFAGLSRYRSNPKDPETIQEAAQEILHATELDPDSDVAYFHLGQIYQEQGLKNKARLMFSRALRINPKNSAAQRAVDGLGGVAA